MAKSSFFQVFMTLATPVVAATKNTRFVNFFPGFAGTFERIRDEECATLWQIQQTKGRHSGDGNCLELLSCILTDTNEYIKANMASGTITLGLAPTILSILGSTAGETALLSKRRPLLAFLIACGSPAVNPLPSFVYENPLEALKEREGRLAPNHVTGAPKWQLALLVVVEYAFVLAAIANVATALYFTGKWSVSTVSCDTVYLPLLWAMLAPVVHLAGMITVRLRTEVVVDGHSRQALGWGYDDLRTWLLTKIRHEFSPCARHYKLVLEWKHESYMYVIICWWTSIYAASHLLYGTIALSSLVFLGYLESVKIIGRLMASVIVCRAVLVFELAGMRNALFKDHSATIELLEGQGFMGSGAQDEVSNGPRERRGGHVLGRTLAGSVTD